MIPPFENGSWERTNSACGLGQPLPVTVENTWKDGAMAGFIEKEGLDFSGSRARAFIFGWSCVQSMVTKNPGF